MPRIAPATHNMGPPPTTRDLVLSWCLVVGGIGVASALAGVEPTGLLRTNLAGVAAILFILVPDRKLRARGEGWQEYGLPWTCRAWGRGAAVGLAVSLVVLPLFVGLLLGGASLVGIPAQFQPRLPPGFVLAAAVQFLAVALPEELFYRGWMQTAWGRKGPSRRILGAEIGPGFLATQALFAAGHLVTLQPLRIATFFPGLLFGWVRARSGDVVAPVVVHALSNLLLVTLEACLAGPR
jgi:membrane protease YdiL (CAAX protease family)